MVITVDFDGTLSRKDVQSYIKKLTHKHEIIILTSRNEFPNFGDNEDIFKIAKDLSIKNIIFTNQEFKYKEIIKLKSNLHLDDYFVELNKINSKTNCIGICVFQSSNWKRKCSKIINNYELVEN